MEKCLGKKTRIFRCFAGSCAFNDGNKCFATSITVGGSDGPGCDTFKSSSIKCGSLDITGTVGVCKIAECRHNECFGCAAARIKVETDKGAPRCATFEVG